MKRYALASVFALLAGTAYAQAPQQNVTATPSRQQTYSASIVGLTAASGVTDFVVLNGSATKTVRVKRASCFDIGGAAISVGINAVRRSTADTSGTPSGMTTVKHDSANNAATAAVTAYTANPTLGSTTNGGIIAAGLLTATTAATSVVGRSVDFEFGTNNTQDVVLRGVAQTFALNGIAGTIGAALTCTITWTEAGS